MSKMKKGISLLVSVIMALGVVTIPAFAGTEEAYDGSQVSEQTNVQTENADSEQPAGENDSKDAGAGSDTDKEPVEPENPEATEEQSPEAPSVSVSTKGSGLYVSWNKVEGCEYYALYRSYTAGKKGSLISKNTALSYYDKKTPSGKRAYYVVYAYADGKAPVRSKEVSGRIFRVYIETGHGINQYGRWDRGCSWKKYQEAKLMIPICRSMTRHLERNEVYVYTDAFKGNKTNLVWTLNWLNKNNRNGEISAFINVHCDYYKAPSGTLALYKTSQQKRLAYCLNKGVQSKVRIRNRGLKKRKDLMTFNSSKPHCVSALYECGNIKKDNRNLRLRYDAYGAGLAKGLCDYLGIAYK